MTDPEPAGSPAVGLLVTTTPVLARLRRVIYAEGLMIRPDGAGRLMLHGDPQDAHVRHDTRDLPPPAPAHELVAQLRTMLSAPRRRRSRRRGSGSARCPPTACRSSDAVRDGLYVVATHSGITLSPLLGELVADELVR